MTTCRDRHPAMPDVTCTGEHQQHKYGRGAAAVESHYTETPRRMWWAVEDVTEVPAEAASPAKRAQKRYTAPAQTVMCLHCGEGVEQHPDGRPRHYCSTRCRVAAHRARAKQDR